MEIVNASECNYILHNVLSDVCQFEEPASLFQQDSASINKVGLLWENLTWLLGALMLDPVGCIQWCYDEPLTFSQSLASTPSVSDLEVAEQFEWAAKTISPLLSPHCSPRPSWVTEAEMRSETKGAAENGSSVRLNGKCVCQPDPRLIARASNDMT